MVIMAWKEHDDQGHSPLMMTVRVTAVGKPPRLVEVLTEDEIDIELI